MFGPVLLGALLAVNAAAGGDAWEWKETDTPHFKVQHQETWLPQGLTIGIERIHFRLGMDLGSFSPWMTKERIGLYVYRDMTSYVHGEFSPPPWSNGVAIYAKRAVAIPTMPRTSEMLRVLSHETTHLLFVSYFNEGRVKQPPAWVNEGLAMLEEADSPTRPETSQWYQDMVAMDPKKWFPMDQFLEISPTKDLHDDKAMVAEWYVQAYSVTHFLVRKHSRIQFQSFCSALRDGKTSAEALTSVYHFRSIGDFQKQWRSWLADPSHKRRVAALKPAETAGAAEAPDRSGLDSSGFQNFSTGWQKKAKPLAAPGFGSSAQPSGQQ